MPQRRKIESWFNIERDAVAAIDPARAGGNWVELASVLDTLCKARQSIATLARSGKKVHIIESMEVAQAIQEDGRYLVVPPLVARDASIIDRALKTSGISAVVICREPKTKLGQCPVVALGSGVTIRVRIEEPSNPAKPSCSWFDHAAESLGSTVVSQTDEGTSPQRQLNYYLAHLPAIPLHEDAFRAAIELCTALASETV